MAAAKDDARYLQTCHGGVMRSLVPAFILKKATTPNYSGHIHAIAMNIDLIGCPKP